MKKKDYVPEVVTALRDGDREAAIAIWLKKKGLAEAEIEATISAARAELRKASDERAEEESALLEQEIGERKRKDLLYGGLWFAGGAVLTVATYSAASEGGGGRYVLAWGPMIYGAFRMLKAL